MLGDQTVRTPEAGRRLLIGEGPVGNGVQCGVDVGHGGGQHRQHRSLGFVSVGLLFFSIGGTGS